MGLLLAPYLWHAGAGCSRSWRSRSSVRWTGSKSRCWRLARVTAARCTHCWGKATPCTRRPSVTHTHIRRWVMGDGRRHHSRVRPEGTQESNEQRQRAFVLSPASICGHGGLPQWVHRYLAAVLRLPATTRAFAPIRDCRRPAITT